VNANLLVSNYQLESRMREIRQSGSVGGEPQSNAASLPLLIAGATQSRGCRPQAADLSIKIGTMPKRKEPSKPVKLLSGGNPQIAKADGDAPVQAYIAAMPDWKRAVGEQLDALIVKAVPKVTKAVKWNSPFYGVDGQGWFVTFHVFTRYVKVSFFKGTSLDPIPPGGTPKSGECRWLDIYEDQPIDEKQFLSWVRQAAAIPGWIP
jgi:hypothetical protein